MTRFLVSVSPCVSFQASPKQPQSATGSARKIQRVSKVSADMKRSVALQTLRRLNPAIRASPNHISPTPKAMATPCIGRSE